MNVLEKILEEIDKVEKECFHEEHSPMFTIGACSMAGYVKEILYSHMDDFLDADIEEKSIFFTLGEDGVLSEYDDTYDVIIHCSSKEDQDQTVKLIKESNWIPVGERFPEDGETVLCTDGEDVFLVEYQADLDAGFGDMDWITAWRPLPEPYRPQPEQQPEPNWRQRMMDHFQKIE